MTAKIALSKGMFALVDETDFEYLNQWKWYCTYFGYASRKVGKKNIMMHRQLLDTPDGLDTDHINGDRLDNRRSNLRVATRTENMANAKLRSDNKSGYRGVYWSKRSKKWGVAIAIHGKSIHGGYYVKIEDAVKAYKDKAQELFGEFARVT